jgi:RNA 2',3'-cyclic 3'-phosphodiesterase
MRSARLFAAAAFTPAEKKELNTAGQLLRNRCAVGRFTPEQLLHITLHFFGQTPLDRLADIEAALQQASRDVAPFTMTTGSFGTFGRRESSVLWLGVDSGASELASFQAKLEKALEAVGFTPEGRAFKAHITLARDVRFDGNTPEIDLPKVPLHVNGVVLMESTTASGKLDHLPLLSVPFRP